ncbi:sugar transferase [Microvirga sesbaniae]|uniref:sugar transferase n=1 Tax=Microvirga sesbaniae TaxID=681392 RepID=UPI0021C690A4|nr:sugar transferase [Microvirga sp. HBU67692]
MTTIAGKEFHSSSAAAIESRSRSSTLGIVAVLSARIIIMAALVGFAVSAVDLLRISFFLTDGADELVRAAFVFKALIIFTSVIVGGLAYLIEGSLPHQIASVVFCSFAIHLALLLLPAFWMIPGSFSLSLTGALASALIGIGIAVAKFANRMRYAGIISEGLSPRMLNNLSSRSCLLTDPAGDPSEFDVVVVSHQALTHPGWATFIARAAAAGCEVQTVTKFSRESAGRINLDYMDQLVISHTNSHPYCIVKRAIDVGVVLFAAPFVLLILAVASLAILMTMGRPILFVQDRVGLYGSVFSMYKLRTMRVCGSNEIQIATAKGDNRITPLGKFLRRYHIDELPQLWNVLKGDMTLIGPRPEQPNLVRNYAENLPGYELRHLVRPGISGWSQVKYGYASTLEETREKLEFDLFYVEQFGPVLDAKIVVKTAIAMFDPEHVR